MKLSNKILLSVFGLVVFLVVTLMIRIRLDIGEVQATEKSEPAVHEMSTPPFESITLGNNIEVSLFNSSEYGIRVTGPTKEDIDLNIDARVDEGNLVLILPENYDGEHRRHKIQITTPMVKKITLNNNAEVRIENLNQDSLEVNLSNIATLVAGSVTLDHLAIEAAGQTRLRSRQSTIQTVRVKLNDRSECKLFNLDGGSITGQVRENASLHLSGWTEKLNVDMDKKARVIKRD